MPAHPCKTPLFGLLIAPDRADAVVKQREEILAGRVTATIRKDWPMYEKGPVMLCCHIDPWVVMADIVYVQRVYLREFTDAELHEAGYASPGAALNALRAFYPDLALTAPLLFIRWANVRGELVDDYRKSHPNSRCC